MTIALLLVARRRVLAREVATQFGLSLRSAYRDVQALKVAGFPIEGTAGDGYRATQQGFLRPLALTPAEAEALAIAAYSLAGRALDLRDTLARATTKLEAALDPAGQRRLRELARRVVTPSYAAAATAATQEILSSLRERTVARIIYRDTRTGKQTSRAIEPLGLVCLGDAWWVVGYCRLRRGARIFRADHLEDWRGSNETFEPRPGQSIAEIIARDAELGRSLFGC